MLASNYIGRFVPKGVPYSLGFADVSILSSSFGDTSP
jgi:hypothetical protein